MTTILKPVIKTNFMMLSLFVLLFGSCDSSETDCEEDLVTPITNHTRIGDQRWNMANYNIPKFRNGDRIDRANNVEEWNNACNEGRPVWCYPNFTCDLGKTYGKLYNFYAIQDARGLAPAGWRLPSKEDFTTLSATLGEYPGVVGLLDSTSSIVNLYPVQSCGYGLFNRPPHNESINYRNFKAILTGEYVNATPSSAPHNGVLGIGEMTSYWTSNLDSSGKGIVARLGCSHIQIKDGVTKNEFHFVRLIKQ